MSSQGTDVITKLLLSITFLTLAFILAGCDSHPRVLWRFHTGAIISHTPAISDDKLVVGSCDHFLYALDLTTGKEIWKTDLGERVMVTPVAEGARIYTGTAAGNFVAVDASSGKKLWNFHTGGMLEYDPCVDSEGIYFGSYDGNLYKINRQGELIWAMKTPFYLTSSCAFYKDLVLTSSWDNNVYGIRRDSGQVVWKYSTGEFSYGGPVVDGDSAFYVSHDRFYRFDAATGELQFKEKAAYAHHVSEYQDELFTTENGITKRSLDGKVIKNFPFRSFPEFRPSIVPPYVIAAGNGGDLYGFTTNTLEKKWKFHAGDLFWSPGIEHNGVYYVGNGDGYVYALKLPS